MTLRLVVRRVHRTPRAALATGGVRWLRSAPPPAPASTPPPLRMPPDMPREDYATPANYALVLLGTIAKYVAFGAIGLGLTAYAGYEGLNLYIEHIALAAPSRAALDDPYAWADENLPFTGGERGGTDPRLGWKARHALRAAYISWEWGAGEASAIQKQRAAHPDLKGRMIGRAAAAAGSERVLDRGYELAEEYIDLATELAKENGISFPPELDAGRMSGPPNGEMETLMAAAPLAPADPTALDLLSLKAGILERMNTADTLAHAKDVYERVLLAHVQAAGAKSSATQDPSSVVTARIARLAHKIGDLAQRTGDIDEAQRWWTWGLGRAGIVLGPSATSSTTPVTIARKSWSWWPFSGSKNSAAANVEASTPAAESSESLSSLSPVLLRASVSILIASSAASAQAGAFDTAAAVQAYALSLIPSPKWVGTRLNVMAPTASTAPETLQATWEASRSALLDLHRASVAHARGDKSVNALVVTGDAADHSEAVLAQLTPTLPAAYTVRGSPTAQPAARVLRDTLLTGAEAYYTHAVLLERAANSARADDIVHELEHASEAYERAMSLSAAESGTTDAKHLGNEDAMGRGEEWVRYWRGYVRTREKIMKYVTEHQATKDKAE